MADDRCLWYTTAYYIYRNANTSHHLDVKRVDLFVASSAATLCINRAYLLLLICLSLNLAYHHLNEPVTEGYVWRADDECVCLCVCLSFLVFGWVRALRRLCSLYRLVSSVSSQCSIHIFHATIVRPSINTFFLRDEKIPFRQFQWCSELKKTDELMCMNWFES